jgi:predicted nucleic acid-binding protein
LIIDANIVVAAVAGRLLPMLGALDARGFKLLMPEHQSHEARSVLIHKIGLPANVVDERLALVGCFIDTVPATAFDQFELRARERLSLAAQRDWPVLALALAVDAAILSNDRDFFGVGTAVWATETVRHAQPGLAA